MNIFKALFGGKKEDTEETKKEHQEKDFEILKYDGVRAMRMRQTEYAVKCFRHALELKDDDETLDYLSQALMANNELLEAMNVLHQLAERVKGNAAVYVRIATIAFMTEDYEAMHEACANALVIDGTNLQAKYYMAVALEGLNRRDDAVQMLTSILSEENDFRYGAMLLRCELYLKEGKNDEALADIKVLDEENPDTEDVLMLKARVMHAMSDLDAAEELCIRVIDLDPFSIPAFIERASVRSEKGDKEGEKADLQMVMELNPEEASNDDNPTQTMVQKMKDSQINPLGL